MFTLTDIPWWYWSFAIAFSLYQGWRGYRLQSLLGIGPNLTVRYAEKAALLYIADMLTHFFCSASGFYSLIIFYRAANLHSATPTAIEHPAILIFLLVYAVLGITGRLPNALDRLQMPRRNGGDANGRQSRPRRRRQTRPRTPPLPSLRVVTQQKNILK